MTYKIKKIYFAQANKAGEPYKDRKGTPFTIANVYFEGLEKSASLFCYANSIGLNWKEGDTIDCTIEENTTDRGTFLNIKLPNKTDELGARIGILENFVRKVVMINGLKILDKVEPPKPVEPEPEDEVSLPF